MASDTTPSGIDTVTDFLDGRGIRYEVLEHRAAYTAAAEARAAKLPLDDAAKTIAMRDETGYRLAVIPASQRLDLEKVRDALGAGKSLRLATEQEMESDFPPFEVGALPPFGPLLSASEVFDRRLLEHERILCNAGDHRHGVLLDPHQLVEIVKPQLADICED